MNYSELKNNLLEVTTDFLQILKRYFYILQSTISFIVYFNFHILKQNKIISNQYKFFGSFYLVLLSVTIIAYIKMINENSLSTKDLFLNIDLQSEPNLSNINRFFASEIKEKIVPKYRFCHLCKTYKPPRSHHCSKCDRCYPKYDHHCYIFDVCIEFVKYKFYYQFLFYNSVTNFYTFAILSIKPFDYIETAHLRVVYYFNLVVITVIGLYSFFLFVLNTFLILNNETLPEFNCINAYIVGDNRYNEVFQEGPIKNLMNCRERKVLNPYNLGYMNNWTQVMGDTFIEWIFPLGVERGTGVKFMTNYVKEEEFI
ncbi:putative S-acyltransferase 16 [Tubulinosema ratisbonensis]|uniref:Palmitoyltransferase n=1 Tax=Tubulinosema ratisbonensis TaxID=291195 RepID=A0A437AP61_9MICR|nr:putative S-acyltransferase 16 [Tubulinosema ratisbonensis]